MESDLDLAQLGSWLRTLHEGRLSRRSKSDIGTESLIILKHKSYLSHRIITSPSRYAVDHRCRQATEIFLVPMRCCKFPTK